jgi:hypothetical protein
LNHDRLLEALAVVHSKLGVHLIFFTVPTVSVAYVMSVMESYESVGICRSHDPAYADGTVLMVAMVVPDFADVARAVLLELEQSAGLIFEAATEERIADLEVVLAGEDVGAAEVDQRRRKT